jgi:aspartate kinase
LGLVVQKFGGSSVANAGLMLNAARIITAAFAEGNDVVAVVSAQGNTTDELIAKAKEINAKPSKRELDMLMASGEQISAALLAMAIEELGFDAVALTGWQAFMKTDCNHGAARIKSIDTQRLSYELSKRRIVVVAGFQGFNELGDITTLGRGGSDTSAVALAAALKADLCQIFTDVDGVYTADPRIVPNAKKLNEISYEEMLELASLGANVLHGRSVELAEKYNVKMQVLSSLCEGSGTYVKEADKMEEMPVRGVARDNNTARISLMDVEDSPGKAFQVFSALSEKNISVDLIIQSVGRDNKQDISFTIDSGCLKDALGVLKENSAAINARDVIWDENVSKVSIVGSGMATHSGVAAGMFEALYGAGINILMIATSEIKISVLIGKKDAERAVAALHKHFGLGDF